MRESIIRRVFGYQCQMPGCGRQFGARGAPQFPVCPECQAEAQRHKEREKAAAKRARQRASQAAAAPSA